MSIKKVLIHSFFILIICCSCGRKSNTIFQFNASATKKVSKLSLPTVRGILIVKEHNGNKISWQEVDQESFKSTGSTIEFLGYNVYRFLPGGGVTSKPITKKPIMQTVFFDAHTGPACYTVRCAFNSAGKIIVGPASQSICVSSFLSSDE